MATRLQYVYKRRNCERWFAQITVVRNAHRAPLRKTIAEAEQDLLQLRKDHRIPANKKRILPRFVYQHTGFRKGYFAKRQMKDGTNHAIQCKAPLRTSVLLASLDAKKLADAQTASDLMNIEFTKNRKKKHEHGAMGKQKDEPMTMDDMRCEAMDMTTKS